MCCKVRENVEYTNSMAQYFVYGCIPSDDDSQKACQRDISSRRFSEKLDPLLFLQRLFTRIWSNERSILKGTE